MKEEGRHRHLGGPLLWAGTNVALRGAALQRD